MSKARIIVLIICSLLVFVAIPVTANHFSALLENGKSEKIIEKTFDTIAKEFNNKSVSKDQIIASVDDYKVTYERFLFYKLNLEMFDSLTEAKSNSTLSNAELINNLLQKAVTVQEAKKLGINVSPEEVEEAINDQKELLYNTDYTGDNKELIQEIIKKRIEITGLSEEDFWRSEQVFNDYEESLYMSKLFELLLSKGEIQQINEFTSYQKKLLEEKYSSIKMNTSVLESLK